MSSSRTVSDDRDQELVSSSSDYFIDAAAGEVSNSRIRENTPAPTPHLPAEGERPGPVVAGGGSFDQNVHRPEMASVIPRLMGVPGVSAFTPYRRPPVQSPSTTRRPINWPPAAPNWLSMSTGGSSTSGALFPFRGGGYRFSGALAVPVGGRSSGYESGEAPWRPPAIGGSSASPGRKRKREGRGATAPAVDEGTSDACSVCGKRFASAKALFGHMRSHPDRGWKGAHPPPRFRVEEEFADINVNRPATSQAAGEQTVQGGGGAQQGLEAHAEVAPAVQSGAGAEQGVEAHGAVAPGAEQGEAEEVKEQGHELFDLNM